jgi:hypothetical protein
VVFSVRLGRLCSVVTGMMEVTLSRVSVVCRLLVVGGFMMLGRFSVVVSCFFVMVGRLAMMLSCFVGHE